MQFFARNDLAARKVLAEVKRQAKLSTSDCRIFVEIYVNCREQGFFLTSSSYKSNSKSVAFSEHRNSDDIVVYYGAREEFARNTNIPNDRIYESARYFRNEYYKSDDLIKSDKFVEAARFIVDYLEESPEGSKVKFYPQISRQLKNHVS